MLGSQWWLPAIAEVLRLLAFRQLVPATPCADKEVRLVCECSAPDLRAIRELQCPAEPARGTICIEVWVSVLLLCSLCALGSFAGFILGCVCGLGRDRKRSQERRPAPALRDAGLQANERPLSSSDYENRRDPRRPGGSGVWSPASRG